jgi:hypothetical protein
MPKNTACKVVISFRSLDVTFAQDKRFGRLSVACQTTAPNNAALLLLHIAVHNDRVCCGAWPIKPAQGDTWGAKKKPPGQTGGSVFRDGEADELGSFELAGSAAARQERRRLVGDAERFRGQVALRSGEDGREFGAGAGGAFVPVSFIATSGCLLYLQP